MMYSCTYRTFHPIPACAFHQIIVRLVSKRLIRVSSSDAGLVEVRRDLRGKSALFQKDVMERR